MTQRRIFRASIAAALAAGAAAGLGAGTAAATPYYSDTGGVVWQISNDRCNAISPDIVDNTYSGGISTRQNLRYGRGIIDISVTAGQSIWGYDNRMALRWDNLTTRRTGVLRATQRTTGATGGSIHDFRNVRTGSGKVRITLTPTNQGALLTLPGGTCSDVFVVK